MLTEQFAVEVVAEINDTLHSSELIATYRNVCSTKSLFSAGLSADPRAK